MSSTDSPGVGGVDKTFEVRQRYIAGIMKRGSPGTDAITPVGKGSYHLYFIYFCIFNVNFSKFKFK